MEEVKDYKLIDELVKENEITAHLKKTGINFKLIKYEKGEMIIKMQERTLYLQFVVRGDIEIYGVGKDGSLYPVRHVSEFTALGDVEFVEECRPSFFVEAKSQVLCLALPLKENRELLLDDNYFLRFVLKSISRKMNASYGINAKFSTLEERLMYYMKEECADNMITSVENTRFQLNCSRRQLQRILKKLVEEGEVQKTGKGCYKLI